MLNNKVLAMAITLVLLVLAVNGECSKSFIKVIQGSIGALPSGTPMYTVIVLNECPTECKIAQIHLSCGLFRSEKLIMPNIFKRVGPNDCLVNNGQPIVAGALVSFEYANTQPFPLAVSSVQCLGS